MAVSASPRPARVGIAIAGAVGAVFAGVCSLAAAVESQVTYALPHGTGHDTLENGVVAAVVAGIAAVLCVAAAIGGASGRLRPLWCAIGVAVCVIVAIAALVLFAAAPRPAY